MHRDSMAADAWRGAIRRAAAGTGVRITSWTRPQDSAARMVAISMGQVGAGAIMDPETGRLWFVADLSEADGPDITP